MDDLRVRRGLVIPAAELRVTASRSSGPGGQNVNKSNTRVTLRWDISASRAVNERQRAQLLARLGRRLTRDGELVLHAGRERSRARNLEHACERLAELVSEALTTTRARVASQPSAGARSRRVQHKKRRSTLKGQRRRPGPED